MAFINLSKLWIVVVELLNVASIQKSGMRISKRTYKMSNMPETSILGDL